MTLLYFTMHFSLYEIYQVTYETCFRCVITQRGHKVCIYYCQLDNYYWKMQI